MRAFALGWPDLAFVQPVLHKLPWGHNLVLLLVPTLPRGNACVPVQDRPAASADAVPTRERGNQAMSRYEPV